jgi:serine/threonine protein kinase
MDGGDVDLQYVLDEQGSKPLPENQCRFIFECIVQAVEHVHSHDLVSCWSMARRCFSHGFFIVTPEAICALLFSILVHNNNGCAPLLHAEFEEQLII